jgi:hypothetical protein
MSRVTNGSALRRCPSWIESFIEHTANLETSGIYRKWAAISTVGAVLEQKVHVWTNGPLFPNLYVFLVGHPGVGKTRTIMAARGFVSDLADFHIAPTSMTMAALVDCMVEAKRSVMTEAMVPFDFHSLSIYADELSAFMHNFDPELIGGLTTFYDVSVPYGQHRRGKDIRIKIKNPQLSILSGTTPSNLMKFMPEGAWDQGLTSRIIMVFSDERIIGDLFAVHDRSLPRDMLSDITKIHALHGTFAVTEDFKAAINKWRELGQPPVPTHPKLIHYSTRRLAHLFKLCMISSADKGDSLLLTMEDFNRAMGWLIEAEVFMPEIFKAGAVHADAKAMDEIYHFLLVGGGAKGLSEHQVMNFAKERLPIHSCRNAIILMEGSGLIKAVGIEKSTGLRRFVAIPKA